MTGWYGGYGREARVYEQYQVGSGATGGEAVANIAPLHYYFKHYQLQGASQGDFWSSGNMNIYDDQ